MSNYKSKGRQHTNIITQRCLQSLETQSRLETGARCEDRLILLVMLWSDGALFAGLSTEVWGWGKMLTPWEAAVLEHCWGEHTAALEPAHCTQVSLLQQHVCGSSAEILFPALARQNATNGLSCHAAHLFSYTQWLSWTNPILFKLRGCTAHSPS